MTSLTVTEYPGLAAFAAASAAGAARGDAGEWERATRQEVISNRAPNSWEPRGLPWALEKAKAGGYAPELLAGVETISAAISGAPDPVPVPGWSREVAGVMPCVPTALTGHPCSMWMPEPAPAAAEVIRVYVSGTAAGVVGADELRRRAAAIAGAVAGLEADPAVRCEVICLMAYESHGEGDWHAAEIMLKRAGEDMTPGAVAFICDPAMARRLGFLWLEAAEEREPVRRNSYGCGVGGEKLDRYKDELVFAYPTNRAGEWTTAAAARRSVERTIADYRERSKTNGH